MLLLLLLLLLSLLLLLLSLLVAVVAAAAVVVAVQCGVVRNNKFSHPGLTSPKATRNLSQISPPKVLKQWVLK